MEQSTLDAVYVHGRMSPAKVHHQSTIDAAYVYGRERARVSDRPASALERTVPRWAALDSDPQKALCGGIPDPYLEPLTRCWSHFVGVYRQILTTSLKN